MNPELPNHERARLEASLTALLLGELPHEQAAVLHQKLAQDAELSQLYDRLKLTINLVRETVMSPAPEAAEPPAPLRLGEERRQKLLQKFKTVRPKEFIQAPRRRVRWLVPVGSAAALLLLLWTLMLPSLGGRRQSAGLALNTWSLAVPESASTAVDEEAAKSASSASERFVERGRVPVTPLPPSSVSRAWVPITGGAKGASIVLPQEEKFAAVASAAPVSRSGHAAFGLPAQTYDDSEQRGRRAGDYSYGAYGKQAASAAETGRQTEAVPQLKFAHGTEEFFATTPSAALPGRPPAERLARKDNLNLAWDDQSGRARGAAKAGDDYSVLDGVASGVAKSEPAPSAGFRLLGPAATPQSQADAGKAVAGQGGTGGGGANAMAQNTDAFQLADGSAQANPRWYFNAQAQAATDGDADKVPQLGDTPALGRFYRAAGEGQPRNEPASAGKPVTLYANKAFGEEGRQTASDGRTRYGLSGGSLQLAEGDSAGRQLRGDQANNFDALGYLSTPADSKKGVTVNSASTSLGSGIVLPGQPEMTDRLQQKEQELAELERARTILDYKIASEKVDADLPKTTMVEVVDRAVPAKAPSSSLLDKIRGKAPEYESKARIKVERDQTDIAGMSERAASSYDAYFLQNELEALQSDAILGKVVQDLKLDKTWGKQQAGHTLTKPETIALLKKKLEMQPAKGTTLLEIGVKSEKPEEAAKIANALADEYKSHRLEQRRQLSKGGISALEDRYKEQEQKVREARNNVDKLREELQIADALAGQEGASPLMTAETLRKLESLRIENKAELVRLQTLRDRLQQLSAKGDVEQLAQALPSTANDSLLSSLLEQQHIAEEKLTSAGRTATPAETAKTRAEVEELRKRITKRVDALVLGADSRLASLSNSAVNLESEFAKASAADSATANRAKSYFSSKRALEDAKKAKREPEPVAPSKPSLPAPAPQPEVQTSESAFSTFSLNVSDVSFKLAGASLEKGVMPEPGTIRSEEFLNALDYRDPEAPAGVPVAFAWERAQDPFAQNRDLLRFSVKTAAAGRQPGRALNLVLLLDNSGSMERADRVQIIREALRVLAGQLQPQDKLSVVTFSRTAHLWVDGVAGNKAGETVEEISGLAPQGGTNLEEAMNLAYQTALRHYLATGVNRVVLLTDGAANLGNVEPEELKQKVESYRKQGIALDCFGIGWEGYNDDLLEVLSRNGDGRYGFINTPEEAATEFAGQLAGALQVAASDVKVQVEFNPARVAAYRQIGYAKHQLKKEQFRDNTVDAAEIGAAESGNALYVVEVNPAGNGPLATVRVRFKVPGTNNYREHEWAVPYTGNAVALEQASPAMRLAAVASGFAEWLADSPYAAEVSPDRLLGYLKNVPEVYGADGRPKKLEWMIRQAKSVAGK